MSESDIHKEMDFWINYKHKNFYVNFYSIWLNPKNKYEYTYHRT